MFFIRQDTARPFSLIWGVVATMGLFVLLLCRDAVAQYPHSTWKITLDPINRERVCVGEPIDITGSATLLALEGTEMAPLPPKGWKLHFMTDSAEVPFKPRLAKFALSFKTVFRATKPGNQVVRALATDESGERNEALGELPVHVVECRLRYILSANYYHHADVGGGISVTHQLLISGSGELEPFLSRKGRSNGQLEVIIDMLGVPKGCTTLKNLVAIGKLSAEVSKKDGLLKFKVNKPMRITYPKTEYAKCHKRTLTVPKGDLANKINKNPWIDESFDLAGGTKTINLELFDYFLNASKKSGIEPAIINHPTLTLEWLVDKSP